MSEPIEPSARLSNIESPSGNGSGSKTVVHIANVEQWTAICTAPDFCKVGSSVVAFNSFAYLDTPKTSSPNVKARGKPVYRQDDILQKVQGDAGQHVVSGTSLSTGHVKILDGHPKIKVNKRSVARQDSRCLINCDSTGKGGAQGKLLTSAKGSSQVAVGTSAARLDVLMKMRQKLVDEQVNFDASDEFFDLDALNQTLDSWIGEIQGTDGDTTGYLAQVTRGFLRYLKDIGVGGSWLLYEGIKGLPKAIQRRVTVHGQMISHLDAVILKEKIRTGEIIDDTQEAIIGFSKAVVQPVVDPWARGQYLESIIRGTLEVGTLGAGVLKALRAVRSAGKVATKVVAKTDPAVFVGPRAKPEFSGDWSNYRTLGLNASPMESPMGRHLVQKLRDRGDKLNKALKNARELMKSGSTLPEMHELPAGGKLYKLVTEGQSVGPYSAFWATEEELSHLKGLSYDQISNRLGLPLASQQGEFFEVHEITATRPTHYFSSAIAPTEEIGKDGVTWAQRGGGTQALVPDRTHFTSPTPTGTRFPEGK